MGMERKVSLFLDEIIDAATDELTSRVPMLGHPVSRKNHKGLVLRRC
jgi:hypothetical protein